MTDQPGEFIPVADHIPQRTGDLRCPHCQTPGDRRTSREVTSTFREIFYMCRNPVCGHTWKASLSYDYGLSPSAIPDPRVDLPLRTVPREAALAVIRAAQTSPDPDQPGLFDGPARPEPPG